MTIVEHLRDGCAAHYEKRSVPNGYRVAVDALAEVSRLDLTVHLQPLMDREPDRILPHFDHWEGVGVAVAADLALVEKAMSIAYKAIGLPYACAPCEMTFEGYGVSHTMAPSWE